VTEKLSELFRHGSYFITLHRKDFTTAWNSSIIFLTNRYEFLNFLYLTLRVGTNVDHAVPW